MEKIIDETSVALENEKIIANILHDIKSPLYSIKFGLENKLDSELNEDIFETTIEIIEYIENFLTEYNFKCGKFKNRITPCNVKEIITRKIENLKYILINKNIHIDIIQNDDFFVLNQIEVFLSSIIGNIISNIAFHALKGDNAQININRFNNCVYVEFKNSYDIQKQNSNLGLDFCKKLIRPAKIEMTFCKTKNTVCVKLKIPELKKN